MPEPLPPELRLSVVISQLTTPDRHHLTRDHAYLRRQLATLDDAHTHHLAALARRLLDAADRGNLDGAHRLGCAIGRAAARHRLRAAAITATTAPLPPLLDQLQTAIANSSDTGRAGGGPAGERSPLGLAALALVTQIQDRLGGRGRARAALADDLRAWALDPARTEADADAGERWVKEARATLEPNPEKTRGIPGECPNCGATHVITTDDTGDAVRRRALQADLTTAVTCLSCDDRTPPHRARFLAGLLRGQKLDPSKPTVHDVRHRQKAAAAHPD